VASSRFRLLFFLSAALTAASCALLPSMDGLSGGTDAGTDAATPIDGPTTETSADASSDRDAAPIQDADAATGPFCATHPGHTLCADFDDGAVAKGWTTTDLYGSGAVALDPDFVSPPSSFLSTVGANNNPNFESSGRLSLDFPKTATGAHVEFDTKRCNATPGSGGVFAMSDLLCVTSGSKYGGVLLVWNGQGMYGEIASNATDGGVFAFNDLPLTQPVPATATSHVREDAVFGPAGSLKITVDGTVVVDAKNVAINCYGVATRRLEVGMYSYGPVPACASRFDNVLFDYDP
jgi:hypothetical protein